MEVDFYITGKRHKDNDGFVWRTFLVVPAQNNPDDILPEDVKEEFKNWREKVRMDYISETADSKLFEQMNERGFATFSRAEPRWLPT